MERWRERLAHLVDALLADGLVTEPRLAAALCRVPRHLFLPGVDPELVYGGQAIPVRLAGGAAQTVSSAPAVMARMIERLGVRGGMRVLEIGSGTGYNAALLAELVGPSGQVVTMESDPHARAFAEANLRAAGYERVEVVQGEGWDGWPLGAPFDALEVTAATRDLSTAWVEQAPRLVLPLELAAHDWIVAFRRGPWGTLAGRGAEACAFVPLRGRAGVPQPPLRLSRMWTVAADRSLADEGSRLAALLERAPERHAVPLPPQGSRPWTLPLYLAARHGPERILRLWYEPGLRPRTHLAAVRHLRIVAVLGPEAQSLCALVDPVEGGHGQLELWTWGEDALAATVREDVARWAMEPSAEDVRVDAVPCGGPTACSRPGSPPHVYDLTVRWPHVPPAA